MIDPESLQGDHQVLAQLLGARRAVSTETLPAGVRLLWNAYLVILEDALQVLDSLITYLEKR